MRTDIAWLDVANRRRSLIGYCLGMAVYALVVVAMYPAFKTSTSLDKLIASDSTAAALFGVIRPHFIVRGWLNGNIYANFFPLIMLLLTIGYGAACLAGQDEDGTLGLLAVLPVRRAAIVVAESGAMACQAGLLAVTVAVLVLIGRSFQLDVSVANVASVSAAIFLMGLDFGLAAMAAGALTGRRGAAIGAGTALAAASYLLSSLAPVVSWIRPGRYASLFYWSVGNGQISQGVSPGDYAVLIVTRTVRPRRGRARIRGSTSTDQVTPGPGGLCVPMVTAEAQARVRADPWRHQVLSASRHTWMVWPRQMPSATSPALRRAPPDQACPEDDLDYLQN